MPIELAIGPPAPPPASPTFLEEALADEDVFDECVHSFLFPIAAPILHLAAGWAGAYAYSVEGGPLSLIQHEALTTFGAGLAYYSIRRSYKELTHGVSEGEYWSVLRSGVKIAAIFCSSITLYCAGAKSFEIG